MASYNYGIGTSGGFGGSARTSASAGSDLQYARVVDIILDSDHPRFNELGRGLALNGVIYRPLGGPAIEDKENLKFFAYQSNSSFSKPPLIGEIVEIYMAPSEEIEENFGGTKKVYYRSIVEMWNLAHANLYPDVYQNPQNATDPDPGYDFEERANIVPLQSFPGDLKIEGRLGQSLRFSGIKHRDNIYSDNSNNGQPFIILRNGQGIPGQPDTTGVEDINLDPNSIYLVSDHTVPLIQVVDKREAYDTPPDKTDVYKGNQILMNAGRIVLNAKEESVLLCALESVGFVGNTVNLDGIKSVSLDASKIHLGVKARKKEEEPVILGTKTQKWLEDLIKLLDGIATDFTAMKPAPPIIAGKLVARGGAMKPVLAKLKSQLPGLKSKKVFTE